MTGWTTHDIVDHRVTWLPGLLSTGGVTFPGNLSVTGMEAMKGAIRASGQYGHPGRGTAGCGPQTRLFGFIGRDPSWQPDGPAS